jgi:hypothetical protein
VSIFRPFWTRSHSMSLPRRCHGLASLTDALRNAQIPPFSRLRGERERFDGAGLACQLYATRAARFLTALAERTEICSPTRRPRGRRLDDKSPASREALAEIGDRRGVKLPRRLNRHAPSPGLAPVSLGRRVPLPFRLAESATLAYATSTHGSPPRRRWEQRSSSRGAIRST